MGVRECPGQAQVGIGFVDHGSRSEDAAWRTRPCRALSWPPSRGPGREDMCKPRSLSSCCENLEPMARVATLRSVGSTPAPATSNLRGVELRARVRLRDVATMDDLGDVIAPRPVEPGDRRLPAANCLGAGRDARSDAGGSRRPDTLRTWSGRFVHLVAVAAGSPILVVDERPLGRPVLLHALGERAQRVLNLPRLAANRLCLYYALGLGVGGFIALHARNAYRMTILARGFGFAVIRIDYRPAADEAAARARAEARGGAEIGQDPSRGGRTRTCNPRFWRPVRYQLRHAPGLRDECTPSPPAT